ncbi:MAG: tetratricopeptide repeat protein [Candidatus Omnitrophota bacterium]
MPKLRRIVLVVALLFCCGQLCFPADKDKEEEKFFISAKAFSDGFYDASLSLFKRFLEEYPQSKNILTAKLYVAKCYYFKEDYTHSLEVLTELEKTTAAEVNTEEVLYWLAEVYFKGKNYANTIRYTTNIIENYPSSKFMWRVYYLKAASLAESGEGLKAQELFEKIVEKCKDKDIAEGAYAQLLSWYFQQKEYVQLISLGEKYLKYAPKGPSAAKVYFYLGESYYARKDMEKSVANYQRALNISIDAHLNDLIRQGLGFAYLAKDDSQQAKRIIDSIESAQLRLFCQGVYYFKLKDYTKALENFDVFLKTFGQSNIVANVYLNKADALYEMGRINDSLYAYQYVLNNFKGSTYSDIVDKTHYGLAWCFLKQGEFKKAIEEFKNTLKFTNNAIVMVSSQIQIADAYQEAENYNQALDMYNEILNNNPNTIYADYIQFQIGMIFLKTKKLEESLLALKNLQTGFPSSKLIPQAQYYLAVGYFSSEAYQEARSLLEDFFKKFPQSDLMAKAQYLYGKCFFNEKNYEKAADIFRAMIGKYSDKEMEELVYIDLGNCYLNLSLYDKAKDVWGQFLAKFSQSSYAACVSLYLGGLYEREKNYPEAERYYQQVVTQYASSNWAKEAYVSLGHLYWSRGDLDRAETYFKKVQDKDSPLSSKSKLYLAKIYMQKGAAQDALVLYDELISSGADVSRIATLEKAYALKDIKEYSRAIPLFRQVIDAGMDSPKIRFSLGTCLEKTNQNKEAIDEYFKAAYIFSKDTPEEPVTDSEEYTVKAYFRVAKIYEKENKTAAAIEIYKKIVGSDTEEAKIAKERLEELGKSQKTHTEN